VARIATSEANSFADALIFVVAGSLSSTSVAAW